MINYVIERIREFPYYVPYYDCIFHDHPLALFNSRSEECNAFNWGPDQEKNTTLVSFAPLRFQMKKFLKENDEC